MTYLRMADSFFRDFRWKVQPIEVRVGEEVTVEMEAAPRFNHRIRNAIAYLETEELINQGAGGGKYGWEESHSNYRKVRTLSSATEVYPGQAHQWSASFRIPRGKPVTSVTDTRRVRWKVSVRVNVPWWPDWRREIEIRVLPHGDGEDE